MSAPDAAPEPSKLSRKKLVLIVIASVALIALAYSMVPLGAPQLGKLGGEGTEGAIWLFAPGPAFAGPHRLRFDVPCRISNPDCSDVDRYTRGDALLRAFRTSKPI